MQNLLVTNACKELVSGPGEHGRPDPGWLSENLQRLVSIDLILVCGKVAQQTFKSVNGNVLGKPRTILMPHPAARMWSSSNLDDVSRLAKYGDYSVWVLISEGIISTVRMEWTSGLLGASETQGKRARL